MIFRIEDLPNKFHRSIIRCLPCRSVETQPESILTLAKLIPERLYTGIFIVITRQKFFLIIY